MTPRRAAPEADATRDLYERYARQIYAYCFHQLGNREEAEDATQSTFLNAFRGLQRGVDPEFETAWLYKIAQNVCLTRQRSSSRRRRLESPGDLDAMQDFVPAHQSDPDELIHLPEALDAMPEQQRRALLLREWQGLSYKEIGEELGLSQPAVETLLFRARRTLAASLTDEPAAKKSAASKLQHGTDAGSAVAILKTLLLSGGAKVAATVATVAATSVVAATPATRHAVEDVVAPRHDIVPVHHVAVAAPRPVARGPMRPTAAAASLSSPAAVSPVHHAAVVHRVSHHAPLQVALRKHAVVHASPPRTPAPVQPAPAPVGSAPAAPVPVPEDSAPATQPVVEQPAPVAPTPQADAPGQQKKVEAAPPAPAPVVESHGNGNGNGRGHENSPRVELAAPPAAPAPDPTVPAPPAAAPPTDPATTTDPAPAPAPAAPGDEPAPLDPAANGNGNGHGDGNGHRK